MRNLSWNSCFIIFSTYVFWLFCFFCFIHNADEWHNFICYRNTFVSKICFTNYVYFQVFYYRWKFFIISCGRYGLWHKIKITKFLAFETISSVIYVYLIWSFNGYKPTKQISINRFITDWKSIVLHLFYNLIFYKINSNCKLYADIYTYCTLSIGNMLSLHS